MSDPVKRTNYGPIAFFGLAMALGPLAALSFGTRYADEETWERANAGLESYEPAKPLAEYGPSGENLAIPEYAKNKNVMDLLASAGVFQTFEQAVRAAGLDSKLADSSGYTLFVPSDEAFAHMPEEERNAILTDPKALATFLDSHVIPGRYTATDLINMREAQTLAGASIDVGPSTRYNGHVGIGGAEVIKTDLLASNGIVHVVDRVIR